MRLLSRVAFLLFPCLLACTAQAVERPGDDRPAVLQALLDKDVAHLSIPGALLSVEAGDFRWSGAAGRFGPASPRVLAPNDLFRAASVAKTFTAAAVLVLVERGSLALDAPIRGLLRPSTVALLVEGGYAVDRITLRHLLTHTAGLFDYTETASFNQRIFDDPAHHWTRHEQIALAMREGSPLGPPGSAYAYGDTAYVLLGEVIEVATRSGLAEGQRSLLKLDQLGLADTWLESLEHAPPQGFERLSHPLYGEVDTRGWDPSWDLFGGGGVVSSTQDLVRFMDALFDGRIFAKPSTLELMLTPPAVAVETFQGLDGAMGINRFEASGVTCYGGYGFFGTEVVRCPALDLTFARTTNQAEPEAGYDGDALTLALIELFAR
ncbi:MAG: serine hydrolase domain-containing protein [Pseudomonas sp.]|uniref:serine hydrolase domain-containing protein n=1 Tax=Pseudomonas sp. TaxID=306 RepID=UPI00339178B9